MNSGNATKLEQLLDFMNKSKALKKMIKQEAPTAATSSDSKKTILNHDRLWGAFESYIKMKPGEIYQATNLMVCLRAEGVNMSMDVLSSDACHAACKKAFSEPLPEEKSTAIIADMYDLLETQAPNLFATMKYVKANIERKKWLACFMTATLLDSKLQKIGVKVSPEDFLAKHCRFFAAPVSVTAASCEPPSTVPVTDAAPLSVTAASCAPPSTVLVTGGAPQPK